MGDLAEVEKLAQRLPEHLREILEVRLLESLPTLHEDEDEGIAQALERDAELETDPAIGMSFEEVTADFRTRRS